MSEEIRVLDHGFVRLDAAEADDLSVVNSARVSFAKRSEYEMVDHEGKIWEGRLYDLSDRNKMATPRLKDADEKLIGFLLKGRHGTPFEHNMMRFHVKSPIFVAREWMRHRIGSFNEWSLRYAKVENPDFYVPQEFRTQVGKPGAYSYEKWTGNAKYAREAIVRHNQDCVDLYNWMLEGGVAREQARIVLPLGMFTEFYWTVNARSLMNFLSLRNSEFAQQEIREYAKVVEELWVGLMPVTAQAFVDNERIAP